ncbi:MAG: NusG domain II-containing protein [Firmicutes bacterium]|nr:NusG domain II-containing protein [Bacillota bacterium]
MTRADRRLLILLFLVVILLLGWRVGSFSGGLLEVEVVQEGREILRLTLAGQETERIPLTLRGGPAFLEVKEGAVRLCRGDKPFCPREVCLATGWIKSPGETIVCVPNRLAIQIIPCSSSTEYFSHTEYGEAAIVAGSR